MKKVAILIENLFDEKELIYPYFRLMEDFEVHLVGSKKDTVYTGKSGLSMKSTHGSADVKAADYAGILIPGGFSPDNMRRTESTKDLVKEFCSQNKPIAAICHGPWMMASCCDLKGKDMTSFFSIRDDLVNAGANWVDKEVVVSGNLITSRNPNDLPVFVKTFVDAVK
ncbi:type 1 glutamine amidotransferase domain-containing protein [Gudongella sp. SC589]|jgi:protease I|uniref:type 1 glutamine amidotransferase domain-containing protein n=1 Tax=Gudongella sp. SC589 TaxID=3385990 RepID=UPI003904DF6D